MQTDVSDNDVSLALLEKKNYNTVARSDKFKSLGWPCLYQKKLCHVI